MGDEETESAKAILSAGQRLVGWKSITGIGMPERVEMTRAIHEGNIDYCHLALIHIRIYLQGHSHHAGAARQAQNGAKLVMMRMAVVVTRQI